MNIPRPFPRRAAGAPSGPSGSRSSSASSQAASADDKRDRDAARKRASEDASTQRRDAIRRFCEVAMVGTSLMAVVGPRRLRPYFQQILAIVGVAGTTVALFRGRA